MKETLTILLMTFWLLYLLRKLFGISDESGIKTFYFFLLIGVFFFRKIVGEVIRLDSGLRIVKNYPNYWNLFQENRKDTKNNFLFFSLSQDPDSKIEQIKRLVHLKKEEDLFNFLESEQSIVYIQLELFNARHFTHQPPVATLLPTSEFLREFILTEEPLPENFRILDKIKDKILIKYILGIHTWISQGDFISRIGNECN